MSLIRWVLFAALGLGAWAEAEKNTSRFTLEDSDLLDYRGKVKDIFEGTMHTQINFSQTEAIITDNKGYDARVSLDFKNKAIYTEIHNDTIYKNVDFFDLKNCKYKSEESYQIKGIIDMTTTKNRTCDANGNIMKEIEKSINSSGDTSIVYNTFAWNKSKTNCVIVNTELRNYITKRFNSYGDMIYSSENYENADLDIITKISYIYDKNQNWIEKREEQFDNKGEELSKQTITKRKLIYY